MSNAYTDTSNVAAHGDNPQNSQNPLLEINTSFADYLSARTRNSNDHIVDGKMDYAFDGDFTMRAKINTTPGWSKMHKVISSNDMTNEFKKLFRSADTATSMQYSNIYNAANRCSERLQANVPTVMVKPIKDAPEIYSLKGEGFDPCIVVTSDIAEICTEAELNYLVGCELGRIQNNHAVYNFAFSYPGISHNKNRLGETSAVAETKSETRNLSYALNNWLCAADLTADRAGIICLDNPANFAETYISIRKKCIPDSFGNVNPNIDLSKVLQLFDAEHKTPVRLLEIPIDTTQDERRIMAGLEFIGCEILYSWRKDLDNKNGHYSNKQTLEIRCDILSGTAETAANM